MKGQTMRFVVYTHFNGDPTPVDLYGPFDAGVEGAVEFARSLNTSTSDAVAVRTRAILDPWMERSQPCKSAQTARPQP